MARIAPELYGKTLTYEYDGCVVGQIKCDNGGRGHITCIVFGSGNAVSRSATASAHYYPRHDAQIRYNTLTMPVCKGEPLQVDFDQTHPEIEVVFDFVRFPCGEEPQEQRPAPPERQREY